MKNVITAIVRATARCNMNCSYCYVTAGRKNENDFPISKLRALIKNVSRGFDEVRFVWHGGEPLVTGIDFYKEVIKMENSEKKEAGTEFKNQIQSNGLLLDDKWMDLFGKNSFGIGISIDAPKDIQLIHRKINTQKMLKKAELIRKYQGRVGALCVISKLNVKKPEEIFRFFNSNGFSSYGILPLKKVPINGSPSTPSNYELFEFYRRTFNAWVDSETNLRSIEPLNSMIEGLAGRKPQLCSFGSSCLKRMVAVTQDGNVIPCSSLEDESFVLGNIFKEPLINIIHNKKTSELAQRRNEAIKKWCNGCEYISICRGGCRSDAYWYSGDFEAPYSFCKARKMTFDYLRNNLRKRVSIYKRSR